MHSSSVRPLPLGTGTRRFPQCKQRVVRSMCVAPKPSFGLFRPHIKARSKGWRNRLKGGSQVSFFFFDFTALNGKATAFSPMPGNPRHQRSELARCVDQGIE